MTWHFYSVQCQMFDIHTILAKCCLLKLHIRFLYRLWELYMKMFWYVMCGGESQTIRAKEKVYRSTDYTKVMG